MQIIEYSPKYAKEIIDVFHQAVHAIDASIYSYKQQQAWAPLPIDYQKWTQRLEHKQPYILLINDHVAGFIELDPDGHIDCAYVLPNYQRQGVASALLHHIICLAKKAAFSRLYVEASIVAKPFFEQFGFKLIKKNEVTINGMTLVNYSMFIAL